MAFPTLNRNPLSVEFEREDNVISSPLEGGYTQRRPRHSRSRLIIIATYDLLSTTDKTALINHQNSVNLSESFTFTDSNSNNYTVYYLSPFKYVEVVTGWWKFEPILMREV